MAKYVSVEVDEVVKETDKAFLLDVDGEKGFDYV